MASTTCQKREGSARPESPGLVGGRLALQGPPPTPLPQSPRASGGSRGALGLICSRTDAPAEPQPSPSRLPEIPHLDLSKATDEVLLLLAARRPGEINEERLQEAAPQIHFIAAGRGKQAGHKGPQLGTFRLAAQRPRATGSSIPKWVLRSCVTELPEIRGVGPGPLHSRQFWGFSVDGPHSSIPTPAWPSPAGDSTGRGGTHRWTQPPLSCWPQRPTHLASLVGGTRRGRGLRLELVSAGAGDTRL